MARDIIDDRLIGALHVRALTRRGFAHDPAAERVAFQVGTLDALIDGRFDGDATIAELLDHGDLGLGTVQHLGGELVILDSHAFVIDADGCVHEVHPSTRTPFAVVCRFAAREHRGLVGPMPLADVQRELDGLASHTAVIAVRVDGTFTHLRLRSVREQVRPYPPLAEVTAHQTEWDLARADGTLLGFRFPDDVAGLEAPGYHLHFLSSDRQHGGHVLDGTLLSGTAAVDGDDQLHVELPPGVDLGTPGITDRARIRLVEGGPGSDEDE
jgi:acetolactate decarboxylase